MTFPKTENLHPAQGLPLEQTLAPPGQEPPDPDAANFLPREDDPFPMHCLPPVMRAVVETVCTARRVPAALAGPVALVCHATALGAGLTMPTNESRDRFTHGNLFAIVAARSGTGKGDSFKPLAAPLEKWERDQAEEWEAVTKPNAKASEKLLASEAEEIVRIAKKEGATSERKARLAAIQKEIEEARALLHCPRLIVTDTTSAAFAPQIAVAARHALASIASEPREAVRILQGIFREGQSDDSLFLAGYSVEAYRRDRKGANGQPENYNLTPCLCLCWSPQTDHLRKILSDQPLREGGFVPRCLILDTGADAEEEPEHPTPLDRRALEAWESLLFSHLRQFRHRTKEEPPAVLTVSAAVFPLMRDYGNRAVRLRKANGKWPSLAPQLARVAENAWRIMANLHAAAYGPGCVEKPVSEWTARKAVELSEWFTRQCLALLFPELARADEKRVEELRQAVESLVKNNRHPSLGQLKDRHGFAKEEVERLARLFPNKVKLAPTRTGKAGPAAVLVSLPDRQAGRFAATGPN